MVAAAAFFGPAATGLLGAGLDGLMGPTVIGVGARDARSLTVGRAVASNTTKYTNLAVMTAPNTMQTATRTVCHDILCRPEDFSSVAFLCGSSYVALMCCADMLR